MERSYWLGFSVFSGIGPVKFNLLLSRFESAKGAWSAPESDLVLVLGKALLPKFLNFRESFSLQKYEKELREKKVSCLILKDKEYPELLKQAKKAPFVLYIKGKIEVLQDQKTIGVVGARKTTHYGREVTKLLTQELVLSGFTIVSGMAFGVDAVAAQTAMDCGGKTIAVLGNGVDICHPITNKNIYDQIVRENGVIVSEVPIGQQPSKGLFPARNRIIAGLSQGVLVTEGSEDSGSLITASDAFLLNRPVFAVPGPITSSMSKGPYKLIEKGAKLVTSVEDILIELKTKNLKFKTKTQNKKLENLTEDERKIINLLQNEEMHFNEIVRKLKKSPSEVGSILSLMEIKGLLSNLGNNSYTLVN
jgi:DNA processing protein